MRILPVLLFSLSVALTAQTRLGVNSPITSTQPLPNLLQALTSLSQTGSGYAYYNGSAWSWATPAGATPGSINYTATGGSTALSVQAYLDAGPVDIRSFGAVANSSSDQSTAIMAAIAYSATTNRPVYVPAGVWPCNLTITSPNVTIIGATHTGSRAGADGSYLVPYTTSLPVLTVGSDSTNINVYGTKVENITLYGVGPNGTGKTGLYLGGGAQFGVYRDATIWQFANGGAGWALKIGPSTQAPIQYNTFNSLDVQGHTASAYTAVIGEYYGSGTSWNTANVFHDLKLNGNALGYAMELDSVQTYLFGNWIQTTSGHSLHLLNDYGQNPGLFGSCNWETTGGNDAVDEWTTTTYSSAYIHDNIQFSGGAQMVDSGSTTHNMNNGTRLQAGGEGIGFHALNSLYFNTTADADPTATTLYITDSSHNLQIGNSYSTTGLLQLGTDGSMVFTSAGKQALKASSGASGVNSLGISTGTTGNGANLYAIGETNAAINITPIGTGITTFTNSVNLTTLGAGIRVKEGANAKQGVATLVAGTVTVANTSVTGSSRIFICPGAVNSSTAIGVLHVTGTSTGTSFTVTSLSSTGTTVTGDLSTFSYEIFEPGS